MTMGATDIDIVEQVATRINDRRREWEERWPRLSGGNLAPARALLRPRGPGDNPQQDLIVVYLSESRAARSVGPPGAVTQVVTSTIAIRHRLAVTGRGGSRARDAAEEIYVLTDKPGERGGWVPDGARSFDYGGTRQLIDPDGAYWVVEDYYQTEWVLAALALKLP